MTLMPLCVKIWYRLNEEVTIDEIGVVLILAAITAVHVVVPAILKKLWRL